MGINKFYSFIVITLTLIISFISFSYGNIFETIKRSHKEYTTDSNISYNYDSKIVKVDNTNIIIFPYQNIYNKPHLIKGNIPNKGEITILPLFSKLNNIKINDYYVINNTKYKIVGYMYNPLFIYPIINVDMPFFIPKKNNIIYMNLDDYNNIHGLLNDHSLDTLRLNYINIKLESINAYIKIINAFLLISLSVIIILVINERIKKEEKNIYLLKSLGYSKKYICFKFLFKYLIMMLIGILLGFILSISLRQIIINILFKNFNIVIYPYNYYNYKIILFPILFFIIYYFYMLIKLTKYNRVKANKFINIFSKFKINFNLKVKILFSNYKILYIFILGIILSIILCIILNIISYLNNSYKESFKDINYKYMIKYNNIMLDDNKDFNVLLYNNNYYNKEDRVKLCNKLNIPLSFNIKYSNDDKYKNSNINNIKDINSIININDLKNNIKLEITSNNIILYIIIILLLIVFIFIITTMFKNIIESNYRNISLLKVLGYNDIFKIIFSIYYYVLIISAFTSIFFTNYLLNLMDIPITNINYIYLFLIINIIFSLLYIIYKRVIDNINCVQILKK